jgi:hypothetical protein
VDEEELFEPLYTSHGSTVTLKCGNGTSVDPNSPNEDHLQCINGQWSMQTLVCGVFCPEYETEGSGDAYIVEGSGLAPYSTRVIRCADGYKSTTGKTETTVMCTSQGYWTSKEIRCLRKLFEACKSNVFSMMCMNAIRVLMRACRWMSTF